MPGLMTIQLKQLRFFGFHGLYPEERKTGNEFEVNLSVSYVIQADTVTDIGDTINYSELYELVKYEMRQTTDLLESLSLSIAQKIKSSYPAVKKIDISISKLNPPIENFIGNVGVNYQIEY